MATYIVNVGGENVKTTVTNSASFVDQFITELILSCNYSTSGPPIIGLDVEIKVFDDSTNCKAATLQLCSSSRCIIIQLINMEVVPQSLLNFLFAPLFCFVGVGIHKFLSLLGRDYGIECRNAVDLKPFLDLAVYCGCVGVSRKPLSIITGDWGADNLNMEQIESAATDAFTLFQVGKLIFD